MEVDACLILTEEHTIRNAMSFHCQPQQWQSWLEGKNRCILITCPPRISTLLFNSLNNLPTAASENERDQRLIFQQPLEVEVFDPDDPIAVGKSGRQLVQDIISQTGDAIMKPCQPFGELALGSLTPSLDDGIVGNASSPPC